MDCASPGLPRFALPWPACEAAGAPASALRRGFYRPDVGASPHEFPADPSLLPHRVSVPSRPMTVRKGVIFMSVGTKVVLALVAVGLIAGAVVLAQGLVGSAPTGTQSPSATCSGRQMACGTQCDPDDSAGSCLAAGSCAGTGGQCVGTVPASEPTQARGCQRMGNMMCSGRGR